MKIIKRNVMFNQWYLKVKETETIVPMNKRMQLKESFGNPNTNRPYNNVKVSKCQFKYVHLIVTYISQYLIISILWLKCLYTYTLHLNGFTNNNWINKWIQAWIMEMKMIQTKSTKLIKHLLDILIVIETFALLQN